MLLFDEKPKCVAKKTIEVSRNSTRLRYFCLSVCARICLPVAVISYLRSLLLDSSQMFFFPFFLLSFYWHITFLIRQEDPISFRLNETVVPNNVNLVSLWASLNLTLQKETGRKRRPEFSISRRRPYMPRKKSGFFRFTYKIMFEQRCRGQCKTNCSETCYRDVFSSIFSISDSISISIPHSFEKSNSNASKT